MAEPTIGSYARDPASFHSYDPRVVEAVARLCALITESRPELTVHHVGSTAVPGLPGKGGIDLAIPAEPSAVGAIASHLLGLGFQPQPGPEPFPATRPMLVGSIVHEGVSFRVHAHVIPDPDEVARLIAFRDALRADPALREAYATDKQQILARGTTDTFRYSNSKSTFIRGSLKRLGYAQPTILPGAAIGILGGGQLGRMLGFAAREMGYRIAVLDPDPDCPAHAIADRLVVAPYDDVDAALEMASGCAVVTYELEHVSASLVAALKERLPVRPGLWPLRVTQDRLAERRFLAEGLAPTAPWREVRALADLREAADALGYPSRLKAAIGGYDGRSQVRLTGPLDLEDGLAKVGRGTGAPLLLERELEFECELSVVCARGLDGSTAPFPVARNLHDEGILVESVAPAPIPDEGADAATALAVRLATELGIVGLLTVEMFLLRDGTLAVNELAPRVHNSGHYTIEACRTSQFEQHIRAICGLPLGSAALIGPAAMVNLLGTGPQRPARLDGLDRALADPLAHVHVYDKRRVFERRKMGHVTVVAVDLDDALERARRARAALSWADEPETADPPQE